MRTGFGHESLAVFRAVPLVQPAALRGRGETLRLNRDPRYAWWMDLGGPRSGRIEIPRTRSAAVGMKVPWWIGMTAGPCGKIAGLTEMEQNARAQRGASALDELSEEPLPAHPGQPSIPRIETAISGPSSCAIDIETEAMACPASPMPKATSRTSARRRASGPCLIGAEVTPAIPKFKPMLNGRPISRSRDQHKKIKGLQTMISSERRGSIEPGASGCAISKMRRCSTRAGHCADRRQQTSFLWSTCCDSYPLS